MLEAKVPDYDTFGYCCKCGKCMISHQVIDGIFKIKLSGEYTTVLYRLNDGSNMRVAMCSHCANNLTGDKEETDMIMAKVWRGWQKETETYSHWEEERKAKYLEEYSKKRIVTRADKLDSNIVDNIFLKYKKVEPKEIKHIIKEFRENETKKINNSKKEEQI
jgi:hypothetical protein